MRLLDACCGYFGVLAIAAAIVYVCGHLRAADQEMFVWLELRMLHLKTSLLLIGRRKREQPRVVI